MTRRAFFPPISRAAFWPPIPSFQSIAKGWASSCASASNAAALRDVSSRSASAASTEAIRGRSRSVTSWDSITSRARHFASRSPGSLPRRPLSRQEASDGARRISYPGDGTTAKDGLAGVPVASSVSVLLATPLCAEKSRPRCAILKRPPLRPATRSASHWPNCGYALQLR